MPTARFSSRLFFYAKANSMVVMQAVLESGVIEVFETENYAFIWAKKKSCGRIIDVCAGEAESVEKTFFVLAEKDAHIEIVFFQNFSKNTSVLWHKFSHILSGASISWTEIHAGGKRVESRIEDFLEEEGAKSQIRNISLSADQEFYFYNAARHLADNTVSHISARGVIGCNGKVTYRGAVFAGERIVGANGVQEGKFLLAAPDAEIDAMPSLDIASAHTHSAHSISISHLDDMSFFYSSLRGIEPFISQAMLFEGFLIAGISEDNCEMICENIRKKLRSPAYNL